MQIKISDLVLTILKEDLTTECVLVEISGILKISTCESLPKTLPDAEYFILFAGNFWYSRKIICTSLDHPHVNFNKLFTINKLNCNKNCFLINYFTPFYLKPN